MSQADKEDSAACGTDYAVGIQVRCRLDKELNMFRVSESKGKALSSGGFGVTITAKGAEEAAAGSGSADGTHSPQFLFIEEVLFLYERGLLGCLHHDNDTILQSAQLYGMIPNLDMSLPMYLVYAHLRNQDFRVLRHAPERYDILTQQESIAKQDTTPCSQRVRDLRQQVRESVAKASVPSIESGGLSIAWDVYRPSADFAKTHPGFPDFYVAVAYFNESQVNFSDIEDLITQKCHGIPLKLATVSDSGTVVMFGATDYGVPTIGEATSR
jgi:hypothetical protein